MRRISFFLILLVIGCSPHFKKTELGNKNHDLDKGVSNVLLIPLGDFSSSIIEKVAKEIENDHKVVVSTYPQMGIDPRAFNSKKQQYIADFLILFAGLVLKQNGKQFCDEAVILLTNQDINSRDFRLRYVFSMHAHKICTSVISTARINPENYGSEKNDNLAFERLMKLINKSLGYYLYGYKASADKNSVMYGPILSPDELDSVGKWY